MRVFDWRRVTLLYEHDAGSDVIPPFCKLAADTIVWQLDLASTQRVVRRDYYKFVFGPSAINFDDVLVNEVGRKFAGK